MGIQWLIQLVGIRKLVVGAICYGHGEMAFCISLSKKTFLRV